MFGGCIMSKEIKVSKEFLKYWELVDCKEVEEE
jgi:hypothetical protein